MVDTVNSPWGLFISNPFERGTLFKVAKMMVLVLHKELENEVEKLKYKKSWRSCSLRSETNPNFRLVN